MRTTRDICVPRIQDGALQYRLMDMVPGGQSGTGWLIRKKTATPPLDGAVMTDDAPETVSVTTAGVCYYNGYTNAGY